MFIQLDIIIDRTKVKVNNHTVLMSVHHAQKHTSSLQIRNCSLVKRNLDKNGHKSLTNQRICTMNTVTDDKTKVPIPNLFVAPFKSIAF
jgi:hypothetical protein